MNTARKILETVLSPQTTKKLWTESYFPVLPFYPNDFSLGAVLPAVMYMFRWGHRRGKGAFVESFEQTIENKKNSPAIENVVDGLLTKKDEWFSGFDSSTARAILGDMLLSFCLENKKHRTGRGEQIQRAYPCHYLTSWIDLPSNFATLRFIPDMIVALLANQEEGEFITKNDKRSLFSVSAGFKDNILLNLYGRDMQIKSVFMTNLTGEDFVENSSLVGIDQLLAIRIAQTCGGAPLMAKGSGESGKISNQHPIATKAAKYFREDLSVFIQAYGETIPRQTFHQMLESCLSLGLTNIYLSTAKMLLEWERTGSLPEFHNQEPWKLFVDCSSGTDTRIRKLTEESMTDMIRLFERLPVIMMCLRILDDKVSYSRAMRDSLPAKSPDATEFINLLGSIYANLQPNAGRILDDLYEVCLKLSDAFSEADEEISVQELLKSSGNPVMRLAEALSILKGNKQIYRYIASLESTLMVNQPNGFSRKRKVQLRNISGKVRRADSRSVILTNTMLDFIVHRHLRKTARGKGPKSITFVDLLQLLKEKYGLYIDEAPVGMSIPVELLHLNRQILEKRVRDLGLLVGVNDAESMKRLQQRFEAKGDGNNE